MKLYRKAVPHTRTNYVLRRKTNQNALSRKKDANNEVTHDVLNYFNVFNIFECGRRIWTDLTCHMKERAWPLK